MTDLNDVLERLMTDPGFRQQLKDDPSSALAGYDLDDSEMNLLRSQVTEEAGAGGSVEQRTSKSALGGALFGLFGGGGAAQEAVPDYQSQPAFDSNLAAPNEVDGDRPTESVSFTYEEIRWSYSESPPAGGRGSEVVDDLEIADPGQEEDVATPGSPQLLEHAASGTHNPDDGGDPGEIAVEGAPDSEMKTRMIEIEDVIVTSVQSGGSDAPLDDASLSQPLDADQPAGGGSLGDLVLVKENDKSMPGSDGDAEHLVAGDPPGADKAPGGKVEYTWKIEEGVKVVDPDGGDLATPETAPEGADGPGLPKGPFIAESYGFGTSQGSGGLRSDGELVQAVSEESNQDVLVGKVTPKGASDEPGQLGLMEFQATTGPDADPGVMEHEAASGEQQGQPDFYEYPGEYPQSHGGVVGAAQSDDPVSPDSGADSADPGTGGMGSGEHVEAAHFGPSFGDIHGASQGDRSVMEVGGLKMETETVELQDADEVEMDVHVGK